MFNQASYQLPVQSTSTNHETLLTRRGTLGGVSDSKSVRQTPSKAPVKLYLHCLVLVDSKKAFKRGFSIKPKQIEGLMED